MKAHLISFGVTVLAVVVGIYVAPKVIAVVAPAA
jgi:hypothetical protein